MTHVIQEPATDSASNLPLPQRDRRAAITLSTLALITVICTVIAGCQSSQRSAPSSLSTVSSPRTPPVPVELPFTGVYSPTGIAVDTAGNVYINNQHIRPDEKSRVLMLPAGSHTQVELPFTGLNGVLMLGGVAVDAAGNVYVADNRRVLKLPAGSNTPVELPFSGLDTPDGVAVDTAGNVYVTDTNPNGAHSRVLKLPAG